MEAPDRGTLELAWGPSAPVGVTRTVFYGDEAMASSGYWWLGALGLQAYDLGVTESRSCGPCPRDPRHLGRACPGPCKQRSCPGPGPPNWCAVGGVCKGRASQEGKVHAQGAPTLLVSVGLTTPGSRGETGPGAG